MENGVRRFACTACGKCCNRSPEVELSEAAALADKFVFRLMFRFYALPRSLSDYLRDRAPNANASEAFYQKKRLLGAQSAFKRPLKIRRDGKAVEYMQYLTISALSLDTSPGACSALEGTSCGIYERRPYACRTVPFHYSRVEASVAADLEDFVATEGYRCDTGDNAPIVIQFGRIVDESALQARSEALALGERDARWRELIVRRMRRGDESGLKDIESAASVGAAATSMRVAWQIAADAGLIAPEECRSLLVAQLSLIDRELAAARSAQDEHETLLDMRAEYSRELKLTYAA